MPKIKSEKILEDLIEEVLLWKNNDCPLLKDNLDDYPLLIKEVSDFYGKDALSSRLYPLALALTAMSEGYKRSQANLDSLADFVVRLKNDK